jgi:hypothetical protein
VALFVLERWRDHGVYCLNSQKETGERVQLENFFVTFIIIHPTARGQTSALLFLKGLSYEVDLTFDDMHSIGQF